MESTIEKLKRQRDAVILAHYYCSPQVQDVADYVGDSLALSQIAATTSAKVILFAGVHFMAQTAKILSPEKTVLLPDIEAGCSLADSCAVEDFAPFVKAHPDHLVISYVNTSAQVKALTDIVVTSSNALKIVNGLPRDQKILFGPDRNLGNYIAAMTGRDMVIWDGACHVHQQFSLERILELKQQYPQAKILAHPECTKPVLMVADHIGSTASLLEFSASDTAKQYIVATESGIIHQMKRQSPDKLFLPAPPADSTCACNDCAFMKLNTLSKIEAALRTLTPAIEVPLEIRLKAEVSIRRMLELSK
ncbi:MAG: quinolinate synthase NadA [Mucinivorans sp.]